MYTFRKHTSNADILTLTREEVLNAVKIDEKLLISKAEIYADNDYIYCGFRKAGFDCVTRFIEKTKIKCVYKIDIPQWEGNDCFLTIEYFGNTACLYEDHVLKADNFFISPDEPWEIGLKRFGKGRAHSFFLEITALFEDEKIYLEKKPPFEKGKACSLGRVYCTIQEMKVYAKNALEQGIDGVNIM